MTVGRDAAPTQRIRRHRGESSEGRAVNATTHAAGGREWPRDEAREGRWAHVLAVGLVAALAWMAPPAARRAFGFADRAIADAGENPPPSVSIRLGLLVDAQEVARAALAVGLMGLTLGVASCVVSPHGEARRKLTAVSLLAAAAIGLVLGASVGAAGRAAFGLRHVGDQDLAAASILQGLVWGGVGAATGAAAGVRLAGRSSRLRAVGRGLVAGLLWGTAYPPLLALISPWTYAERMMPESSAASIAWSSFGTAAVGLAVGRVFGRPRNPRGEAPAGKSLASAPVRDNGNSTRDRNQE